jgi:glucose-6-phosphate isomerase
MDPIGISFLLGQYQSAVTNALAKMLRSNITARIWAKDHRLWKPKPDEIINRLGWLNAPAETLSNIGYIRTILNPITEDGVKDVVLLGMGGSSLAADVFNRIFGSAQGFPRLHVLDTTDPGVIRGITRSLDLEKTIFLVSSKSGTTLEINCLFHYYYNLVRDKMDSPAEERFIFITDQGSALHELSFKFPVHHTFLNNSDIGGRYSALSLTGIVPAAIIGVDIEKLLQKAAATARQEKADFFSGKQDSNGCLLGAALGTLAQYGRDKLTLFLPPLWAFFGDWLEQLIAESTGKEGKGILPILNEPWMDATVYGKDRVFVFFYDEENEWNSQIAQLATAGHPILKIRLNDSYDMGSQMFLWEMATAVAAHLMGINPFDQPDVEATKIHTRRMIDEYRKKENRPQEQPALATDACDLYGNIVGATASEALTGFLKSSETSAYVCLQVYLHPSPEIDKALAIFREAIFCKYGLAVTIGYGPRYLHSTGQLHKGDAGHGLFIQFTDENKTDIDIPDELGKPGSSLTFGTLKAAQAEGDRQALTDLGRKILRIHWRKDAANGLRNLAATL